MEKVRLPKVIDPETGLPERVGNGRIAVFDTENSRTAVSRLIRLPKIDTPGTETAPDTLDEPVATGRLHNN